MLKQECQFPAKFQKAGTAQNSITNQAVQACRQTFSLLAKSIAILRGFLNSSTNNYRAIGNTSITITTVDMKY